MAAAGPISSPTRAAPTPRRIRTSSGRPGTCSPAPWATPRGKCAASSGRSRWPRTRSSARAPRTRPRRPGSCSPTRARRCTGCSPPTTTRTPPAQAIERMGATTPFAARLDSTGKREAVALVTHTSMNTDDAAAPDGAAASREPVISVSGLTKQYGDVQAVRGIDFEVARGETFGFLGPNGAGKTTTIKILCTLANATSGAARVAGHDAITERDAVRRNIGLVFQDTTLDTYLTAEQNLRFHAELYGVPKAAVVPRMHQVMDMVGLWERKDSLVSTYSGGMQRRLEIARGLLHAPHVLFLDEPTVGLDPQTRSSIWAYINDLKRREDIAIFDHGKIVAIDTPEALKASIGEDRVQIQTADDDAAIAALKETFGIEAAVHEGAVTFSVAAGEQFVPRLFAEFTVPIRSVSVSRPSLDDVFMSYTGTTIRDAEASGTDAMRQMAQRFRAGGRR